MANIKLKGRDTNGNLTETIYKDITSVVFETEEGGTVIFHESDVTAQSFNEYVCVPVNEGDPEYDANVDKLRVVSRVGSISTPTAKAVLIYEDYLDQYGFLWANTGKRAYWNVVTFKTCTVGEAYPTNELFDLS